MICLRIGAPVPQPVPQDCEGFGPTTRAFCNSAKGYCTASFSSVIPSLWLSPGPRSAKLLPPRPYNPAHLAIEDPVCRLEPTLHLCRLQQRLELRLRQAAVEPHAS